MHIYFVYIHKCSIFAANKTITMKERITTYHTSAVLEASLQNYSFMVFVHWFSGFI